MRCFSLSYDALALPRDSFSTRLPRDPSANGLARLSFPPSLHSLTPRSPRTHFQCVQSHALTTLSHTDTLHTRSQLPFDDRWLGPSSSTMARLSRCLVASLALLPALSGVALADHPVARDSGFRLALRRRQDNSTSTVASVSLDSAAATASASVSPTESSGQSATDASNATASPTSAAVDSNASYPPSTATDSAGLVGPTGSASTYAQGSGGESSCAGGGGGSSVGGGVSSSSDLTVLQLAYVLEVRSPPRSRLLTF